MDSADRVKCLISKENQTQKKFAENISISPARLNNYLSKVSKIPQDILIAISEKYKVSLSWLLTGEGDMYMGIAREGDYIPGVGKMVRIPVVAPIAAGPAIEVVDDEPLEIIQVGASLLRLPPPYYAFKVEGESMAPFIQEGDIVVLSRDWRGVDINDKICGFRTADGITLKRYLIQPKKKTAWLMPMNHDYHPIQYDRDTPDLELVGVLVLSIRRHV